MLPNSSSISLLISNILIPIAVLVFATGFFPYKPFIPGLATYQSLEYGDPPEAPFDKVIFMVVDALRSDFVYSVNSGFSFTQSLIRSGVALPFTAHASSPTITMPRVKAMTTGSVPSFLDVILNFAESDTTSTLAHQDTWLAQLKAKRGGRLVMYGDDTWLKLFPETFTRADGTSSFFVSDFTEVDNNVTRHVPEELNASDWNAMIMHYLGLDHIGHKAGPLSPNMIPKQVEMDRIVEQIYHAIETKSHLKSTIFILCGDHGMNDGGNHGGSGAGETSPALVFMSPKLKSIAKKKQSPTVPLSAFHYYTLVEQSDIAPTLAGLLGFPIPLNNLGVFIPDFLPLWNNGNDRVQLLLRNALQILNIVKMTFSQQAFDNPFAKLDCSDPTSSGTELACKWRRVTDIYRGMEGFKPKPESILPALTAFCKSAQSIMSSTASNYDVSRLLLGIGLAGASAAFALIHMLLDPKTITISATGTQYSLVIALYGIMMFASSYVEEEQHFWYWTTSFWFMYLGIVESRHSQTGLPKKSLGLLLFHRIVVRWNQTGQKHAGAPDIAHFLLSYPVLIWTLVISTYLTLSYFVYRDYVRRLTGDFERAMARLSVAWLSLVAIFFKFAFVARDAPELLGWFPESGVEWLLLLPLVKLARGIFAGCFFGVLWLGYWEGMHIRTGQPAALAQSLHNLLSLIILTQTRTQNIPLFFIFTVMANLIARLPLISFQRTLSIILLTHTSFFSLGNSNAISSIDLSNAYNGVSGYNVIAVGILVFISNWAGPIWWTTTSNLISNQSLALDDVRRKTKENDRRNGKNWILREREHLASLAERASDENVSPSPQEPNKTISTPQQFLFIHHVALLTFFTSVSLLAIMIACTALRTHLFIWTVFSPKYLYAMAWCMGHHIFINIGLGGLMWWVGKMDIKTKKRA
ncbi:alkaline phosphatase-like protein [Patellaria atrata CBS 101060]|uniref:GPI ethanolamine phosphate transferase 2 n=1 Tax=Patellaria atrata CBS 101060 TaxID=1346257 RepID=A0A9P4VTY3_9PEZI|nr:alkaline phosphatase-like protein [Patellaria atrata CBS 101060]